MKWFFLLGLTTFLVGNTYDELVSANLISEGEAPKLHLGCGRRSFEGYVNIDFPLTEQNIKRPSGADYYCDILQLRFENESVKAVRNHHVFEHFSRPVALALLTAWHQWLEEGGELYIETPDFEGCIRHYLREKNYKKRQAILRHLFGSHDEHWAVHWDGWYPEKFRHILTELGYSVKSISQKRNSILDNVHVIATKEEKRSLDELRRKAREILQDSMVSRREQKMLDQWFKVYNETLDKLLD